MPNEITKLKLQSKSLMAALDIELTYTDLRIFGRGSIRIGPISSPIVAEVCRSEDQSISSYEIEAKKFRFFETYLVKSDGELWFRSTQQKEEFKIVRPEESFYDPLSLIMQVHKDSQVGKYSDTYRVLSGNKVQLLNQSNDVLYKNSIPVVKLSPKGFEIVKPKITVGVSLA